MSFFCFSEYSFFFLSSSLTGLTIRSVFFLPRLPYREEGRDREEAAELGREECDEAADVGREDPRDDGREDINPSLSFSIPSTWSGFIFDEI